MEGDMEEREGKRENKRETEVGKSGKKGVCSYEGRSQVVDRE